MSDFNLSDEQSRQVADQIREELARRRISRKGLADQAKISILDAIAFTFCSARRVDARFPLPSIPGRFPSPSTKCQPLEKRSVFHAIRATRSPPSRIPFIRKKHAGAPGSSR